MQTIYPSYENFYKNTFSRYLMFYGTDARLQYIIAGKMCIVVLENKSVLPLPISDQDIKHRKLEIIFLLMCTC